MNTGNLTIQQILDQEKEKSQIGKIPESKLAVIQANRDKNSDPFFIEKVKEGLIGLTRSEESKLKMSAIQKEICKDKIPTHLFDPDIRKKASDAQKGIARPQTSAKLKGTNSKLKGTKRPTISSKLSGKPKSEEHKVNMRKPKIKSPCTICGMMVAPNIMKRYHGDNCKHKK